MKHFYRWSLMVLALVWTGVAFAQIDTNDSFKDGYDSYQKALDWFYDKQYSESERNLEEAFRCFEQNLEEPSRNELTIYYMGKSYYLLCRVYRNLNKDVGKSLEKKLLDLPENGLIERFMMHYVYSQFLLGDDFLGIEPDYCGAFQEFEKILGSDAGFEKESALVPLLKDILYQHASLLIGSYVQNISDTTSMYYVIEEIPILDSCIGGQQLDRCIDDLYHIIHLGQAENDESNLGIAVLTMLGECYFYKGEYEKSKACYDKLGYPSLFDEKRIADFQRHYDRGIYLFLGDSLHGVTRDYCGAFQEFETILGSDLDFEKDSLLGPLLMNILYLHAALLFESYYFNIPDTTNVCDLKREIPEWDSCIGDQQLDRCIDDLNRYFRLGQAESNTSNFDTLAMVLLGECHYYKKEYKEAIECYEKSGMSPEQLDIIPASCFWSSYLLLGINDNRLEALAGRVIEAYRNDYALYHLLYRDVSDDKMFGKEGDSKEVVDSWLNSVHLFLLYYVGQKEYDKAFDFWLKIKNNFSLSPILLMDQALCRLYLGDFSAISDFAYAYNLLNSRRAPDTIPSEEQLSDDEDIFKTIKDAYNEIALSALYIEKNYEDAKEYYVDLKHPTPEENLMLGVCYKNLNMENGAKRRFYEVISMEDSIGKISETPYAYLFLGEYDKAVESMEQMLKTGFPSKISNEDDSLNCFGIHYQAAEIYAKVGMFGEAQGHFSKSLEYCHNPFALAIALKMPLLDTIRDYVEQEVNRYSEKLGILESKIQRDTIVCDIPFKKSSDYTRTIKCKFQMNDSIKEIEMLFDPGADKCQFNIDDAMSLGITNNDIIACIPLHDANGNTVTKPLVSLNKVIIGDIELENVQAVIDSTSNAHSLLGCTVLNNLKVEMPSPVNKGKMRFTYIKESIEIPETKKTLINNEANENLR